jgi:hypothetical protein
MKYAKTRPEYAETIERAFRNKLQMTVEGSKRREAAAQAQAEPEADDTAVAPWTTFNSEPAATETVTESRIQKLRGRWSALKNSAAAKVKGLRGVNPAIIAEKGISDARIRIARAVGATMLAIDGLYGGPTPTPDSIRNLPQALLGEKLDDRFFQDTAELDNPEHEA